MVCGWWEQPQTIEFSLVGRTVLGFDRNAQICLANSPDYPELPD